MSVWPIKCGNCGDGVAAEIVSSHPNNVIGNTAPGVVAQNAPTTTFWLRCPSCEEGSVKLRNGAVYPTAPAGGSVKHLPVAVDRAWREARTSHAVAAYTASEMMCRKILMYLAVDKANAST